MAGQYDIAVIGGGIAGLTAANHALQGDCSVAHIIGTEPIGGLVCNVGELSGYPAGDQPLSGIGQAIALSAANAELGAVEMMADATSVSALGSGFRIDTNEGEIISRNIIAATGARLRMLDVPGAHDLIGRGVSQCAWCDGALYKGKNVVVVGGGDAALEEALHLANIAAKVTVITRGAGFRARRSYVTRIANIATVDSRWMCDVVEIIGGETVEAVRVHDRKNGAVEEIACDGAFVFIGIEANSGLLEGLAEFDERAAVVTDERMQTATPGIYAIGALRSGYRGRLVHAVGEAATAAMEAVTSCGE